MNSLAKLLCCLGSAAALAVSATKQPTLPTAECAAQVSAASGDVKTTSFPFRCQLAAFGAYLPEEGTSGKVVLAPGDGMLGCSPLFGVSDQERSSFEGAAVVVRRGGCSFQDKLAHVAATGAALMVLVNSEDAVIPLSSLEYEPSTAAAVSVAQSDGERLIQMVKGTQNQQQDLTGIKLGVAGAMGLVSQARARLQFLVDVNAPVSVYEEYVAVAEQLGSRVGTLDEGLSLVLSGDYESINAPQGNAKIQELVTFFSWSAQQVSKWRFASEASLHAIVAAAVLQIHLWTNEAQTPSRKGRSLVRAAVQQLSERGYYSHGASLLRTLVASSTTRVDTSAQCLLSFLRFLQGDVITVFSPATGCKTSELDAGIPSLKVAQETFNRLTKLTRTAHDEECLDLAAGSLNDTNLALTCCYLVETPSDTNEGAETLSRKFSSKFTKELFHSLVLMGVFLDELGPFDASLRFFGYAARLCQGEKTTLELRRLLAVPVVFSSQNEMDVFIVELKRKLDAFTETLSRERGLQERVISPLGRADESNKTPLSETGPVLRPEDAAYLQYTITPPTMFIGYQGINVLPIQRAVNKLRTSVYPSLSSSFKLQKPDRSEESMSRGGHRLRRVGFISTWFRVHSVGKLLLGVVQNLDRTKFHVAIYHCAHFLRDADEMTEAFKRTADEFVELPESQDSAVLMLRQAQLDVAIFPELGMDEWTVLLSHHRVAPIQCVFWGHPITTGNPHIDYFISSEHFVSENFDESAHELTQRVGDQEFTLPGHRRLAFSEEIVLFRGLSTIFTEPTPLSADSKEISRSRLYLPTNRRLYVCPQTLMKLHPAFDEALAGILDRDDKATIVLLASDTQLVWTEQCDCLCRMKNHWRVLFLSTLPFAEFQALLTLADVVLDPFPFGGGVTTLDALHLGVPVVTLPAAQSVVHLAAGFLRYMNASDCIADSLDEYIQLAVNIAMNHDDIRQRLLSHRSDIYQDGSAVEDWNTFLDTVTPRMTPSY
ncbi:hypothetical protein PHYPSEUDO_006007 [Phytophthora pseudosyringae]|uniref:O-GlcNAc transferase C-terminal domain-containing protein n=1 Tax=Phytophthora pseudosyringae TaxID=221518 RepID=A0A8T1VJN0_9STRA|nr:hypothetical protein PHYPSEUDO_006007 [Phytophthora pseudosyringae]